MIDRSNRRQRTLDGLAAIVGDAPTLLIAVGVDEPVKIGGTFKPTDKHAINRVHVEISGNVYKLALATLAAYVAGAPDADRDDVRRALNRALDRLDLDPDDDRDAE